MNTELSSSLTRVFAEEQRPAYVARHRYAAPVEFGLLGSLRVSIDGREVGIGSPKLRVLLACLLLKASQPVSTDELSEAIWGEREVPDNPRRAVQLCVTRLRGLLGAGAELIVTRPGAYLLNVVPAQTDVGRFQHWLLEAECAEKRGDATSEADALAQALAQWRGGALDDVPSELLHRESVPYLTELRLQAVGRRIDAELRLGRHERVLQELIGITAQHPLREWFWVLLMRAQAACGRRSEALTAYHTARQHLSHELGVDPGEALYGAYLTVLSGQSSDIGHPIPRQLPADVAGFTGRESELERLDSILASSEAPAIAAIVGTAGIGKTSLAVHWSRRAADAFPDGQLWLDMRSFGPGQPVSAQQALATFLRALGVADNTLPPDPSEQAALYRSLLDGRRILVVLDNVSHAEQVRQLLPGGPGSLVLITSRNDLTGLVASVGAHSLVLDLLSLDEARAFFAHRLGTRLVNRRMSAIDDLIASCAQLPLALAVVAARIAGDATPDPETTAADLRGSVDLDAFAVDDFVTDVRAVFSWSYRALSPAAAVLFRLLGLHPGPDFRMAAAASMCGVTKEEIRPVLAELCAAHLINRRSWSRYDLHDLLRAYAGELVCQIEQTDARSRMLAHYLHSAVNACRAFDPHRPAVEVTAPPIATVVEEFDEDATALRWLSEVHPVLLAAVELAYEHGEDEYVWSLTATIAGYLDRRSYWHDLVLVLQTSINALARLGDSSGLARAHRCLGGTFMRLGQLRDTRSELERARRLTDEHALTEQAKLHTGFGWLSEAEEDYREASRHHHKALVLNRALGDLEGEGRSMLCIAWDLAHDGRPRLAITYSRRALPLLTQSQDLHGQAAANDVLGYAYHKAGQFSQAIASYAGSLEIFNRLGFRYEVGELLNRQGDVHQTSGDRPAAVTAWREALRILDEMGHSDAALVRKKLDESAENEPAD